MHLKNEYRAKIKRVIENQKDGSLEQFMNRLNEHIVPPTTSPTNIIRGICACNPSASSVQEVQSNYVELLIVHLLSILISHFHSTLANSSASTAPSALSTTTSPVVVVLNMS